MDVHSILTAWQDFELGSAVLVFFAYILVDGAYAYYTLAVASLRPKTSATVGSLMHFLIAFGVLNYVKNYLYVIPLVLGSWLGTYIVVKYSKDRKLNSSKINVA